MADSQAYMEAAVEAGKPDDGGDADAIPVDDPAFPQKAVEGEAYLRRRRARAVPGRACSNPTARVGWLGWVRQVNQTACAQRPREARTRPRRRAQRAQACCSGSIRSRGSARSLAAIRPASMRLSGFVLARASTQVRGARAD